MAMATATAGKPMATGTLKITLVRSLHGRLQKHQACARGLGLRRMHQTVEVEDTPANRGMARKIAYMVECEPAPDA